MKEGTVLFVCIVWYIYFPKTYDMRHETLNTKQWITTVNATATANFNARIRVSILDQIPGAGIRIEEY